MKKLFDLGRRKKNRRSAARNAALARWKDSRTRRWMIWSTLALGCFFLFGSALGQDRGGSVSPSALEGPAGFDPSTALEVPGEVGFLNNPDSWFEPSGLSSTLQIMLLLTVLSLAPAILLMTTSFVRIVIVLGLLRQALGTQQLPPGQVITTLAMFLTLLIMGPVWTEVYNESIAPYTDPEISMTWQEAFDAGTLPIKKFMGEQIKINQNNDDIWLFYQYLPEEQQSNPPEYYHEVPLQVLLPAFMLSELKTAFLIGFNIYLPFLILDIVISSVTISMGMLMLPPVIISLPFKLMLFVLVDGWNLVVGMLLESFVHYT